MLPSTGYFKAINCPFYESGACDRPYCHFKHSKREDVGVISETAETVESSTAGQVKESKATTMVSSNSDVLQKLVTEAVKKVLANQDVTDTDKLSCQNVVSQVVEGLTPTLTSGSSDTLDTIAATNTDENRVEASTSVATPVPCVYNPTPIAELKKRHIPIVSYMPTRESRVAVKRKCSLDGAKPWLATGCESMEPAQTGEIKYKPTTIVNSEIRDATQSYIPTYKSDSSASYFYNDEGSNEYLLKLREPYYPKCKRRREEYVPKKVKAPLKSVQGLRECSLDQFEADFGAMNEVLTRGKSTSTIQSSELLQDSYLELEGKFSDDDEDDSNAQNVNKIDSENADCPSERNVGRLDHSKREHDTPMEERPKLNTEMRRDDERNYNEKILRNSNVPKQKELISEETVKPLLDKERRMVEAETDKSSERNENTEQGRSKDKNKEKSRKDRSRSHKRHKDKRDSNESSRSVTSRTRSDSKNRPRREKDKKSKDTKRDKSKDRDRDRERDSKKDRKRYRSKEKEREREKEKEKERERERGESKHKIGKGDKREDYCEPLKGNEYTSNNHCGSSRRYERSEKRSDGSKRTKTNRRFSDKASNDRKERSSTDRSASSLESVGSNAIDDDDDDDNDDNDDDGNDDNDDEENNDYHKNVMGIDVDITFSTSDSDHDIQEECLKIFQEYQVAERPKMTESSKESPPYEKEQNEEIGRKRVAHPSAAVCVTRQTAVNQQPKKRMNPQQKMYERWRSMRDAITEKSISLGSSTSNSNNSNVKNRSNTSTINNGGGGGSGSSSSSNVSKDVRLNCVEAAGIACNNELKINGGNGRIRIAHVPYAKSLAIEKKKVTENTVKLTDAKVTDNQKTAAQTAKSGLRIAHVPQVVPQLIRPEPLQVTAQKFPLNVRQYYVNMMHDVCVLIYTNAEDAAQRAVKEEHACHERCKALAVYKNSCMLATHRLRKEIEQKQSGENNTATTSASSSMVSHEAVLAGKAKGSWSVLKTKKSVTEFKGAALYGMLKKWIMTEQQLRDNGFPRPHPDGQKGRAKVYVINSRNQSVLSKVPNERICCRCGQAYMIDKQGFASRSQNCIYHWGRKFTIRGEGKYSCCQQYGSATGCCDAKTHVWDYTDYENLRGYVKTLPKGTTVEDQGVYALDCEMCYTTQGLELTRITIIDEDCNVVYETLVKPQNPIIDYNTRFSGITEENMKNVTTTLLDVQATMLTMFSENTILVGHSLESDFKALKLLHDTVVDTSVMFPHKNGYPQKRALKNLCSEYLRKIIQNDVGGHDSKEDAMACMELILWKAKEEAKLQ